VGRNGQKYVLGKYVSTFIIWSKTEMSNCDNHPS